MVDSERLSDGDVVRLVQLVVLCAVNSGEREEVVGRVLEMSEKEQETMMFCINDISSRIGLTPAAAQTQTQRLSGSGLTAPPHTPGSAASSLSLPSTSAPSTPTKPSPGSNSAFSSSQQLQALEREAAQLRRVNAQQLSDIAQLRSEQEQQSTRGDEAAAQLKEREWTERLQREQQRHTRELAEAHHRAEEAAGGLHRQQRASLALEKEKVSLLSSLEELRAREKEWQDRVQLAETRAEQAAALEAKVARLTARLDSVGDLQAQAEYSEEEARRSAERVSQLEREAREAASMREGLQRLKASLVKKEEEALDFRLRQEELEAEVAELREAVKERERQAKEAESEVRRLQEALRERDSREREAAAAATATSAAAGFELIGTPTSSLRAKLRKLEADNEELRTRLREGGGAAADRPAAAAGGALSVVEESELDIARSVAKANESRYLEAMRKLQQLEREMKRLQRPQPSTAADQSEDVRPTAEQQSSAGAAGGADAASAAAGRKLRKYYELWKHSSKKVQLYRQKEEDWRRELTAAREQVRRLKDVIGDREREVEVREKVRLEEMNVSLRERKIMQAAFYELGLEYASAVISGRLAVSKGAAAPAGQLQPGVERTGGRVSGSEGILSPSQHRLHLHSVCSSSASCLLLLCSVLVGAAARESRGVTEGGGREAAKQLPLLSPTLLVLLPNTCIRCKCYSSRLLMPSKA